MVGTGRAAGRAVSGPRVIFQIERAGRRSVKLGSELWRACLDGLLVGANTGPNLIIVFLRLFSLVPTFDTILPNIRLQQ